jgi:hypothetical protein
MVCWRQKALSWEREWSGPVPAHTQDNPSLQPTQADSVDNYSQQQFQTHRSWWGPLPVCHTSEQLHGSAVTLMASATDGRSGARRLAMSRRKVLSLRGRASLCSRGTLNLAAVQRTAATQYTEAWVEVERRGVGSGASRTRPLKRHQGTAL